MKNPRSRDMRNMVRASLKRDFGPPIKHHYRMGYKFLAEGDLTMIIKEIQLYEKELNDRSFIQLYFNKNSVGENGCEALSKANWHNLKELNLCNDRIGSIGCKHICRAQWQGLTSLCLTKNKIGEKGCHYLSKANWKNLQKMILVDTKIKDRCCRSFSKANWRQLKSMDIQCNKVTEKGCQQLCKPLWPNLRVLHLELKILSVRQDQSILKVGEEMSNAIKNMIVDPQMVYYI